MNGSNKLALSNAIRTEVRRYEIVKNNFAKLFKQLESVDDLQLRSGLNVHLHSIQGKQFNRPSPMACHWLPTQFIMQGVVLTTDK